MASFSINNSTGAGSLNGGAAQAMTTTYKSIVAIAAQSSNQLNIPTGGTRSPPDVRRGKIYDILIGSNSTPGDTVVQWDLSRLTTAGSSINTYAGGLSSVSSAYALDTADNQIAALCFTNSTVETNITALNDVWSVGINQRASYRWVAAPGSEFIYPAVSSNGLDLRALGPSGGGSFTGNVTATVLFLEL